MKHRMHIWLLSQKTTLLDAPVHQYSLLRARLGEGSTHGESLLAIPLMRFNDLIDIHNHSEAKQ